MTAVDVTGVAVAVETDPIKTAPLLEHEIVAGSIFSDPARTHCSLISREDPRGPPRRRGEPYARRLRLQGSGPRTPGGRLLM